MNPPVHWARVGEAGALLGLRAMYAIHRGLGRWPFRIIMLPVMLYFFLGRRIARHASLDYLRHLNRSAGGFALYWKSFRHFLAFGECILDKALAWSGQLALDKVQVSGMATLKEKLASGQGAVLLVSHLGNIEVSRALAKLEPTIHLTVLVHTKHARRFNHFLAALSPDSQADLIQVTEVDAAVAIMLAERIARGELVVIAADRVPVSNDPRVVLAPFLGQAAPFPIGPFLLASLLNCPVFLLFCVKQASSYGLHFEHFADSLTLPRATREIALQNAAARFAQRLEHYCRMTPLQWFNFYPFWTQPVAPLEP